ncbi:hypothetical protein [Lactobacillus sp. LL6]|uniref:hypothetical protein n=1 Tax=Lactobacillus sp. LL6 TaxID=2596827 RepID=UPI001F5BB328|nr:hypothetical protein [Lactobacillus sp. LL6]
MKLNKLIASIILNIIILITSSGNVFASPSSDNSEALNLYNQGIRDGKIQKSTYNYSDFLTAYDQAKDMYLDIDNNTIDFEEYFAQDNNYGAMPDGSSPFANDKSDNDEEIYSPFLSLYTTLRRAKFMGKVKKGDILLVGGAVGHAAIATTDNYILEMPGGYNVVKWLVTGIPNNNSQKTKSQWIDKWCNHGKAKIQIWRPKNKTMSSKVANYEF